MSKYKKQKTAMVDLSSRKKIKIIEAEKSAISDDEIEAMETQLETLSKQAEEFHTYIIQQELKNQPRISDDDFDLIMKNILKHHKILKCMIEKKDSK